MAEPMTPDEVVRALTHWRVPFRRVDGWRTRNRNKVGLGSGVRAGPPSHGRRRRRQDRPRPDRPRASRSPGPLAQFGCDDDGTIWLVACGRANHAGGGDPRVLGAIIEESYGGYPPKSREHTGSDGSTDGNDNLYGVETFYSGSRPPRSGTSFAGPARRGHLPPPRLECEVGHRPQGVVGLEVGPGPRGHEGLPQGGGQAAAGRSAEPGRPGRLSRARGASSQGGIDPPRARRPEPEAGDRRGGAKVRVIRGRTRASAEATKEDAARLGRQ